MATHSEIVRRAGRADEVAHSFGVSIHTVHSWVKRNSIPDGKWMGFARNGHATLLELAEEAERKANRAA